MKCSVISFNLFDWREKKKSVASNVGGSLVFIDDMIKGRRWSLTCIDLRSDLYRLASPSWATSGFTLETLEKPTDRKMVLWLWNHGRNDRCFCLLGVKVFIEKKAQLTLLGTEMDFVETKLTSEFIFNNPNIKGMCGCGESFSIWTCEPAWKDWGCWGSWMEETSVPTCPLLSFLQTTPL